MTRAVVSGRAEPAVDSMQWLVVSDRYAVASGGGLKPAMLDLVRLGQLVILALACASH